MTHRTVRSSCGSADAPLGTNPASGFLESSMRREMLNLTVDRDFLQRLLATGRAFDCARGFALDRALGLGLEAGLRATGRFAAPFRDEI